MRVTDHGLVRGDGDNGATLCACACVIHMNLEVVVDAKLIEARTQCYGELDARVNQVCLVVQSAAIGICVASRIRT